VLEHARIVPNPHDPNKTPAAEAALIWMPVSLATISAFTAVDPSERRLSTSSSETSVESVAVRCM
jgi:hypothetical protein